MNPTNEIGCFLGYDPGGNKDSRRKKGHGVAILRVGGDSAKADFATLGTVQEVLDWFDEKSAKCAIRGVGIDTLTYWSAAKSGWRGADLWLRKTYPDVVHSVAAPNSLYGAMSVNGMFVLRRLRCTQPEIFVTETHPKVLYHALRDQKYIYLTDGEALPDKPKRGVEYSDLLQRNEWLAAKSPLAGSSVVKAPTDDHQWDALVSAWAAHVSQLDKWTNLVDHEDSAMLDFPARRTEYRWPYPADSESWKKAVSVLGQKRI